MIVKSPVQEIGIAIQQGSSITLNAVEVAEMRSGFVDRYPLFQQVPLDAPIDVARTSPPALEFITDVSDLRYWMMAADSKMLLQYQHDRLGLNWRRLAPSDEPADYPGFDQMLNQFNFERSVFSKWVSQRQTVPAPIACELFYINAVPLTGDMRISEVLEFYTPTRRTPVMGLSFNQIERLTSADGTLTINCGIGTSTLDASPAVIVNFTARCNVPSGSEPTPHLIAMHQQISDVLPFVFTKAALERFS